MGREIPSAGMNRKPAACRERAKKSQYLKKNRIARLKITEDATAMYNYRRYVFDNVDVDIASLINISVDFYYAGSVNYNRTPYSSIVIYEPVEEGDPLGLNETVKLTGRDKRALAAFGESR